MICIHHNDADGHCAAAIVAMQIAEDMEPKNFIEYGHSKPIELSEEDIHDKERVFIVDLALDENIMEVIRKCLKKDCQIVHIDHHVGGKTFEENLNNRDKILYERVTNLYRDGVSGCMLTFVYASMTPKERVNPMDVPFDFTEDYSHLAFYPDDRSKMREYFIPHAVRFIDDNDVWRLQFQDTKFFIAALTTLDTHPLNQETWKLFLYDNDYRRIVELIDIGKGIFSYQTKIYQQANHNGFEATIDNHKGWIVNCPIGNSRLFGDKYDEYDFVCKYSYDGSIQKWRYTFYSKDDSTFDCAKVCRNIFEGNGHKSAAGGSLDYNYFHRAGTKNDE